MYANNPGNPLRNGSAPHQGSGHDLILLGRMLAGQDHIIRSVDRIYEYLLEGDRRMNSLDQGQARHDERISSLERHKQSDAAGGASRTERLIARWATFLIPLAALVATGSWELAAKLMSAMK